MAELISFFKDNLLIFAAGSSILGGLLSLLIGYLMTTYLPNTKIRANGVKKGLKVSKYLADKLGADSGESIENSFFGGLFAWVEGFQEGLSSDNKKK